MQLKLSGALLLGGSSVRGIGYEGTSAARVLPGRAERSLSVAGCGGPSLRTLNVILITKTKA